MASYQIFTRGSDRKYDGALVQSFPQDIDAMAFAQNLLEYHSIVEVWRGEIFIVEISGEPPAPSS